VCLYFLAIQETSRGRYQDAPFGAPSPLNVEGRELKAQLARRRGNAKPWLLDGDMNASIRSILEVRPVCCRVRPDRIPAWK
jgi:hypothetical protein